MWCAFLFVSGHINVIFIPVLASRNNNPYPTSKQTASSLIPWWNSILFCDKTFPKHSGWDPGMKGSLVNQFFFFSLFWLQGQVANIAPWNFGLYFPNSFLVIILHNIRKLGNNRQVLLQIVDSYYLSILRNRLLTPRRYFVRSQLGCNVFLMQSCWFSSCFLISNRSCKTL